MKFAITIWLLMLVCIIVLECTASRCMLCHQKRYDNLVEKKCVRCHVEIQRRLGIKSTVYWNELLG